MHRPGFSDGDHNEETTIIVETFLMATTYKTYQYIAEYIERVLAIPTILLNGDRLDDFTEGCADVRVIDAQTYIQLQNSYPSSVELIATPLLLGKHENEGSCLDIFPL